MLLMHSRPAWEFVLGTADMTGDAAADTRRARAPALALYTRESPSAFLGAIAQRDALFLGVLRRRLLDHRPHDRLVGADPVGDGVPLRPVPLEELHRAAAFMVRARHLQRLHETGRAELLEFLVVDIEVLQAPADLVAGHRLALAEMLLRGADRLGGDDAEHDSPVVVDRADAGTVLHLALALGVDRLLDVLDHGIVRPGHVECRRIEAFRGVARRD